MSIGFWRGFLLPYEFVALLLPPDFLEVTGFFFGILFAAAVLITVIAAIAELAKGGKRG